MQTKSKRALRTALFFLGISIGLTLAAVSAWADFEAVFYDFTRNTDSSYNGLVCPILMTQSETGIITANFNNPLEQTLEPYYQVEISNQGPFRKFENQISVAGHGVRSVQWTVDANDIDLGFFIMVKMTILPVGGYLTREATCGIIILNIPGLTGGQIFTLAFGVSLVGMIVGADLWENANEIQTSNSANQKRSMRAMAISALLAMLAGFLGWWEPGILLCAITILLFATFLQFLIRE